MPAVLIYLDTCCFNRPFDDQSQTRIRFETAAKLQLQQRVRQKKVRLVWSYLLDFENSQNPFPERAASILLWRNLAEVRVGETGAVLDRGRSLLALGIKPFDALHVACALVAGSDLFSHHRRPPAAQAAWIPGSRRLAARRGARQSGALV